MAKSRNWCWTLNNYEEHPETWIPDLFTGFKYLIFGLETAPTTGTPHLQGYVDWINPRTKNGLKKIDSRIHWEIRQGTWEQAVNYCKEDGKWYEWGTPNEQGDRKDLKAIKDDILNGKRVDDIALEDPGLYHQYGRTLNKLEDLAMRRRYRTEFTKGIWYCGPTAVGKSHLAFEGYTPETHYVLPKDKGWWDGYVQQGTVVINDFRGEISYNDMLNLVDKWPMSVSRRGREPMPFTSNLVIITSSLRPEQVYRHRDAEDSIEQLLRRFEVIVLDPEQKWSGNTRPTTVPGDHRSLESQIED